MAKLTKEEILKKLKNTADKINNSVEISINTDDSTTTELSELFNDIKENRNAINNKFKEIQNKRFSCYENLILLSFINKYIENAYRVLEAYKEYQRLLDITINSDSLKNNLNTIQLAAQAIENPNSNIDNIKGILEELLEFYHSLMESLRESSITNGIEYNDNDNSITDITGSTIGYTESNRHVFYAKFKDNSSTGDYIEAVITQVSGQLYISMPMLGISNQYLSYEEEERKFLKIFTIKYPTFSTVIEDEDEEYGIKIYLVRPGSLGVLGSGYIKPSKVNQDGTYEINLSNERYYIKMEKGYAINPKTNDDGYILDGNGEKIYEFSTEDEEGGEISIGKYKSKLNVLEYDMDVSYLIQFDKESFSKTNSDKLSDSVTVNIEYYDGSYESKTAEIELSADAKENGYFTYTGTLDVMGYPTGSEMGISSSKIPLKFYAKVVNNYIRFKMGTNKTETSFISDSDGFTALGVSVIPELEVRAEYKIENALEKIKNGELENLPIEYGLIGSLGSILQALGEILKNIDNGEYYVDNELNNIHASSNLFNSLKNKSSDKVSQYISRIYANLYTPVIAKTIISTNDSYYDDSLISELLTQLEQDCSSIQMSINPEMYGVTEYNVDIIKITSGLYDKSFTLIKELVETIILLNDFVENNEVYHDINFNNDILINSLIKTYSIYNGNVVSSEALLIQTYLPIYLSKSPDDVFSHLYDVELSKDKAILYYIVNEILVNNSAYKYKNFIRFKEDIISICYDVYNSSLFDEDEFTSDFKRAMRLKCYLDEELNEKFYFDISYHKIPTSVKRISSGIYDLNFYDYNDLLLNSNNIFDAYVLKSLIKINDADKIGTLINKLEKAKNVKTLVVVRSIYKLIKNFKSKSQLLTNLNISSLECESKIDEINKILNKYSIVLDFYKNANVNSIINKNIY